MINPDQTSTPAKTLDTATSNKRELPSPFSPDDHLVKKNRAEVSDISGTTDSSMNSSVNEAIGDLRSIPHLPLDPDPEVLRTVNIIRTYLRGDMLELVKAAVTEVMDSRFKNLQDEYARLSTENAELRARVSTLENSVEEAEQYSRRNNLRITNIPERDSEETDQIILNVARALNSDISPSDIDRSHRVGKPKSGKHRDILVKFATYRARQRMYTMRSSLKDSEFDGVFLYEDLTKVRSKLLYEARVKVKGDFLQAAWSADGKLFVKDFKDKVYRLINSADIAKYCSPVAVKRDKYKDRNRRSVSTRGATGETAETVA